MRRELIGELSVDSNVYITNAGGLDQYGYELKIGADGTDHLARTDGINKTGAIIFPHETIAE